jgi:putative ABC transport system ATP-binding protein
MITLEDVSKSYPGTVTALHEVSLSISQGEMVGVVGPSGSGKSTLLHLIGCLDTPTTGRVVIDGHDVGTMRDRDRSALRAHRIGFVFQQFHLLPGMSARDNVADGLVYTGLPLGRRRARADEALASVGLAGRAAHRPHQMSGGERQRVAIARAMVGQPAILLADEPTGNLDSGSGKVVMELLARLHGDGATVVVITHDTSIALTMPRLINLRDGEVIPA